MHKSVGVGFPGLAGQFRLIKMWPRKQGREGAGSPWGIRETFPVGRPAEAEDVAGCLQAEVGARPSGSLARAEVRPAGAGPGKAQV